MNQLLDLDARESPHGLYGIREAHKYPEKRRLPTFAEVISNKDEEQDFVCRLGYGSMGGDPRSNQLGFDAGAEGKVHLQILQHASTKVRHFGTGYQLDRHHGKKFVVPEWDLEQLVPGLRKSLRESRWFDSMALLLIAHTKTPREMRETLRRSTESDFLKRYGIHLLKTEWQDRYGRGFHTTLCLWWIGDEQ
jgi:hypothetical protein